jgi:ATP-binding cassette subfamily C protein CydCD
MLAGFPLLILDEPGEHLDTTTADCLVGDLLDLTTGCSTILITHRLTGLEAMDEVVYLDAGRVIERGTHNQLLVADGAYARQWRRERHVEEGGRLRGF